jgi:hypothetical protein
MNQAIHLSQTELRRRMREVVARQSCVKKMLRKFMVRMTPNSE